MISPELSKEELHQVFNEIEESKKEEKTMSEFAGFGDFDITDIPESIVRDTYVCILADAKLITPNNDEHDLGAKFWQFKFEVDGDEHPDFAGESARVTVNVYSKLNKEKFDKLPDKIEGRGVDQKRVREAAKFYKKFARWMGYSPEEIQVGVNFGEKAGQKFKCALYPDKNGETKVNVSAGITPVTEVGADAFSDFEV